MGRDEKFDRKDGRSDIGKKKSLTTVLWEEDYSLFSGMQPPIPPNDGDGKPEWTETMGFFTDDFEIRDDKEVGDTYAKLRLSGTFIVGRSHYQLGEIDGGYLILPLDKGELFHVGNVIGAAQKTYRISRGPSAIYSEGSRR